MTDKFEDTVRNLLRMKPKPHKGNGEPEGRPKPAPEKGGKGKKVSRAAGKDRSRRSTRS